MKLTFIRKTKLSGDTNCPALYRTEGGFVVVGRLVEDLGAIAAIEDVSGLGAGECPVFVPADVLAEIAKVHG